MDSPCSSLVDYWTNFETEESYTPLQDYHQPEQNSLQDTNCFDIDTFYNNVVDGNGPACYVKPVYQSSVGAQTHSYYNQPDDGPLDQNNNNNNYCNLTSYQDLKGIPQADLCLQVAQEVASFPAGELFFSPLFQETDEVPPELVVSLLEIKESGIPVSMQQEIPEEMHQELPAVAQEAASFPAGESFFSPFLQQRVEVPPELVVNLLEMKESGILISMKQKIPEEMHQQLPADPPKSVDLLSHLPLKKRRHVIAQCNIDGKYPCPCCERFFNHQGHLTQHYNAHHSVPKNQRCSVCGKRFHLLEELEKHQLRHKEQNKKWVCGHCPKKFNYKFDMIRHVKAVHTKATHSCEFCGKGFVRQDHLRQHENLHRKPKDTVANKIPTMKRKRDDNDDQ